MIERIFEWLENLVDKVTLAHMIFKEYLLYYVFILAFLYFYVWIKLATAFAYN